MIATIKKHWTNLQNVFEANNKVTKKKVINTILAFFCTVRTHSENQFKVLLVSFEQVIPYYDHFNLQLELERRIPAY